MNWALALATLIKVLVERMWEILPYWLEGKQNQKRKHKDNIYIKEKPSSRSFDMHSKEMQQHLEEEEGSKKDGLNFPSTRSW